MGFLQDFGISFSRGTLPEGSAAALGFNTAKLQRIDSICKRAIELQAAPGCVVVVAKNGQVVYEKAFGTLEYNKAEPVYPETIYDLASVTKVCATTISVMKLYDEGKLDLNKTLGYYLPWVRGTDKDTLKLWDIMLHQAGLKDFIPFYAETMIKDKRIRAGSCYYILPLQTACIAFVWQTIYTYVITGKTRCINAS